MNASPEKSRSRSFAGLLATVCTLAFAGAPAVSVAGLLYETGNYAAQDALLLHFDGIRNAGALKAHDSSAEKWIDLAAGNAASFGQVDPDSVYGSTASLVSGVPGWTADGYYFDGSTYALSDDAIALSSNITVQVVCDVSPSALVARYKSNSALSWPALVGCATAGDKFVFYYGANASTPVLNFKAANSNPGVTIASWGGKYATARVDNGSASVFESAAPGASKAFANKVPGSQRISVGSCYGSAASNNVYSWFRRTLVGTVKAVRIYGRALTAEELAANREIDEARFFGGIPVTNVVVATSLQGAEGNEAAGAYAIDGDGYVFTAPETATVDGVVRVCAGHSLETWNGSAWSEPVVRASRAFAATDPAAKVRVTWLWAAAPESAGGVLADAAFSLDLRGDLDGDGLLGPGEIGNALDFSSPAPVAAGFGDARGFQSYGAAYAAVTLPAQETAVVTNPLFRATSGEARVLRFYQDNTSADGLKSAVTGVVLSNAATHAETQTFYVRFRWDGMGEATTAMPAYMINNGTAASGWADCGTSVYVNTNSAGVPVLGFRGAKDSGQFANCRIAQGEWTDAFVTFAQNAGNTGYSVTASCCTNATTGRPALVTQTVSKSVPLLFDSPNVALGLYHDSSPQAETTRAFRGAIADLKIWDRALTDAEKYEVMAGRHGAKWTVGAANGSGDEFNDGLDAGVPVSDPYLPESQPWNRMRKALTAQEPSLSLSSPLAAHEAGKTVALAVSPILAGTGASATVAVSVNGAAVGSLDLAQKTTLLLPRDSWRPDASGNVTVTIARTGDLSGAIVFDALTLSGSWQASAEDASNSGLSEQPLLAPHFFAGDGDSARFPANNSVGANMTNYTFHVYVPGGLDAECSWRFKTKVLYSHNAAAFPDQAHELVVNGAKVAAHSGAFEPGEVFAADIPGDALHPGLNDVQWVQTAPAKADLGGSGLYQTYDYWAMTLLPPPDAFVMIVR